MRVACFTAWSTLIRRHSVATRIGAGRRYRRSSHMCSEPSSLPARAQRSAVKAQPCRELHAAACCMMHVVARRCMVPTLRCLPELTRHLPPSPAHAVAHGPCHRRRPMDRSMAMSCRHVVPGHAATKRAATCHDELLREGHGSERVRRPLGLEAVDQASLLWAP